MHKDGACWGPGAAPGSFSPSLRDFVTSLFALRLRDGQRRARERSDDLLAMKAAIFDENFAGVISADDHAGEVQAANIALERLRIESRFIRF